MGVTLPFVLQGGPPPPVPAPTCLFLQVALFAGSLYILGEGWILVLIIR